MATTSDQRGRYDPTDGLFEAVQDDAALFGSGTIASRPASGTADGDFYVVLDQPLQIFRVDRWSAANSAWMVALNKATSDPTASDDQAAGYFIGSMWVNTSTPEAFICTDATPSLANWTSLTAPASGITEAQHEVLDTLVHAIAETHYLEVTRDSGRISSVGLWTDSGKSTQVRGTVLTRDSSNRISTIVENQYDGGGTLSQTMTGTVSRTEGRITSIDWVET